MNDYINEAEALPEIYDGFEGSFFFNKFCNFKLFGVSSYINPFF